MSYSRWGASRFYTFWRASDAKRWEDEIFDVDCDHQIRAEDLEKNMDHWLDVCCTPTDNPANPGYYQTAEDMKAELRGYMETFLKDVKLARGEVAQPEFKQQLADKETGGNKD